MPTIPTESRTPFLAWCTSHREVFLEHFAAIGMSEEQAEGFAAQTDETMAALLALNQAREAYKSAVLNMKLQSAELREKAAGAVRSIRAYAEGGAVENPVDVYTTARINSPHKAGTGVAPPPAQPRRLAANLRPTGEIEITWKASNPRGTSRTVYLVRRKLPGDADFVLLGVVGKKKFVDDTVPAGARGSVQYIVQGQRGRAMGPMSMILPVSFGNEALAMVKVEARSLRAAA